jgi:hypothetical protein
MGLFKKAKDAAAQAQQAQAQQQGAQQGDGMVHVRGAGPIDPAVMGGPSTRSAVADDPIWAPINASRFRTTANSPATRRPAASTTRPA